MAGKPTVPFLGFAESYVLSAFRRAGVPLQRIRPAVNTLSREIRLDHALASRRLYTDGAEVLFDYARERSERDLLELVVVRTGQKQFSELVRDYLRRITYGDDGWVAQLRLPTYGRADVVVDPHVAFGLPMVVQGRARRRTPPRHGWSWRAERSGALARGSNVAPWAIGWTREP